MRDFLSGVETRISAHEGEKCRVLRGRPDALYGNLVVEFERSLPAKLKEAKSQLQRYLTILRTNRETGDTYFIPIASDGVNFIVFAPTEKASLAGAASEEIELVKIEDFDLEKRTAEEFYYWLDRYFLREHKREPRAENFLQDFGSTRPAFRFAAEAWLPAIARIREHSDFQIIYRNWQKYLRIAYGTAVGDEHLFVRHTYLATLAKLIAYIRIQNTQSVPEQHETVEIIQGTYFEKKGVLNFLEEDFFSWVGREPVGEITQTVVSRLVNLLFTYQVRELSEDVMKELYQELVDPKERRELGEFYTPDWLADRMCHALLDKSGEVSVLDPACGSGTFLYQAIPHKKKRLPESRESLEKILGSVVGIDIHPLAVIVSKMNVLLALGDLFRKRTRPVSVQVYLADSIRHPESQPSLGNGGVPAERVVVNEREVLIPDAVLKSPAMLDEAVRVADEFAKSHRQVEKLNARAFEDFVRREALRIAAASDYVVETLFGLAEVLHEFIRKPEDTIWAYILKNQYKPTFLKAKFDVVIGNPPWLSFRFVEKGDYQTYLKRLIVKDCGLLEGAGHLITHLELGTLFFVRCANLYLKASGRIGFVLPRSIFTADQHDRFRRSQARGNITLTGLWDLEEVSKLFNVPAAVAFGDLRSDSQKALPGEIISGQLKRKNSALDEAKQQLTFERTEFYLVQQGKRSFFSTSRKKISAARSFYQPHFKEGATLVPRNFWFVEIKGDPRLGIDPHNPLVSTDPRAEAEAKPPYKGVRFEDRVEAEFLYGTLLSTDLLPFGHFDFRPVVLPVMEEEGEFRLLHPDQARRKGYLKLAVWLERSQKTWDELRKEKAKRGDVFGWLNYRNKLTEQNPKGKYVVLYPKSATFLCAAVIRSRAVAHAVGTQEVTLQRLIADHVTYYFETNDRKEAQFLAGVLNSPTIDELVKPMQARGLWGPRDIHKKVWELPIPEFDENNRKHGRLAEVAAACEEKVKDKLPDLRLLFKDIRAPQAIGRARTEVRKALADELQEIDSLVKGILT